MCDKQESVLDRLEEDLDIDFSASPETPEDAELRRKERDLEFEDTLRKYHGENERVCPQCLDMILYYPEQTKYKHEIWHCPLCGFECTPDEMQEYSEKLEYSRRLEWTCFVEKQEIMKNKKEFLKMLKQISYGIPAKQGIWRKKIAQLKEDIKKEEAVNGQA